MANPGREDKTPGHPVQGFFVARHCNSPDSDSSGDFRIIAAQSNI
jgi:hypothetical protein